jgi:class 3 adenylate cyclase
VHITARVSQEAGTGELWVSETVRQLLAGSGITFEDRGVRALKGVEGEWRLYRALPA